MAEVGERSESDAGPARFDPRQAAEGKNPLQLDSRPASIPLKDYTYQETRYTMLVRSNPEAARELLRLAQDDVQRQWRIYEYRASMPGRAAYPVATPAETEPEEATAKKGEGEE